jgi:hypothetical protein
MEYLQRSTRSHNSIRVFRSASRRSRHNPLVGMRYDGLYHIAQEELPDQLNANGGRYSRFILQREPGQEALASIRARSPSRRQVRDYRRIRF